MIVSGSLNVVIYSWVNHIAKEMLPCIPGSWSFTRCFLQGTPVRWGDDSIRTVEEEGRQRHSRPGSRWGKKEKWDWRENWGKTEKPQWKAFFSRATGKFNGSHVKERKEKAGSVGAWADEVIKLLGCISIRGWEEVLLGVMLARCWTSCVQLLNEALRHCQHVCSHISAGRVRKGGKFTDPLVVLYFSHGAIIVYLPTCLTCS